MLRAAHASLPRVSNLRNVMAILNSFRALRGTAVVTAICGDTVAPARWVIGTPNQDNAVGNASKAAHRSFSQKKGRTELLVFLRGTRAGTEFWTNAARRASDLAKPPPAPHPAGSHVPSYVMVLCRCIYRPMV